MQSFRQRLDDALTRLHAVKSLVVAFSGGLDSCVLLHALKQHYPDQEICAVHVNHQLQTDAVDWQNHCQTVCDKLSVMLYQEVVNVNAVAGESLEARARELRYQVFAAHINEDDCLLTAHHQDDQAETLLLQLLRGAGPHGLAAMPIVARFGNGHHARPLLNVTRDEIHAYAQQNGLQWIEDHSNADTAFDRNYLRHEIMPCLKQRWPAAAATLSRSSQLCADAAHLLDARARQWLENTGVDSRKRLPVPALQQLDDSDCRNVLRYWLHQSGWPLPTYAHLQAIVHEVIQAREDAAPLLKWDGVEVRRFDDELYVMHALSSHDNSRVYPLQASHCQGQQSLALPGIGELTAQVVTAGGVDLERLRQARLQVRFRQGGERCRQIGHLHSQSLKKLMQQWRIPPWQRGRIPLIYNDDELVCVVGHCICEGYQAGGDAPGVLFRLEPSS